MRDKSGRTGQLTEAATGGARQAAQQDARAEESDEDQTGPLPGHPEVLEGRHSSVV
jgi:hypothetical protein